jgi:response regulator RpfG family c-di-GMP phosphodiesterase/GGDEF domain-containing protein
MARHGRVNRMSPSHGWRLVLVGAVACMTLLGAILTGSPLLIAVAGIVWGAACAVTAERVSTGVRARHRRAALDPVSGLPGHDRLLADIERALGPDGFGAAIHICVLQGMGRYNDAYGEACGDAMIGWLARKLSDTVAGRATVYRLRGASFAVMCTLAEPCEDIPGLCATALLEVGEGFVIRGAVGRATLPREASSAAAGIEMATRRAVGERRENPADAELRPPENPLDVLPLVRPRYGVAEVAARIGRRLGLDPSELDELEAAAHLRDVGNMALPNDVLTHAGELPDEEWEFVRLHTVVGERLLAANFGMESVARLVRASHERFDGSGYPDGLRGADIPLGARILFVCGAFQDMTSMRSHRTARSASEALAELAAGAGSQFDPDVVAAFEVEFAPSPASADEPSAALGHRPLHVLVADDDPASRFLLARAIDAAGHRCTTAEEGLAAWRSFRRLRPDVVICDSALPKINAERLCRRIRQDEVARQTYFVTLVALQDGQRIQRDPESGADDYLTKPFDREDLETLLAVAVNEVILRQDPQ